MTIEELRKEIFRLEWDSKDWGHGPKPLRDIERRKAEELKEELRRRLKKKQQKRKPSTR